MTAAIRYSRSRAARWLALLAGLSLAVAPGNLLAQCGCMACACRTAPADEVPAGCCCQAAAQSCCESPEAMPVAGCGLANTNGGCCCEVSLPEQPAETRDTAFRSARGEHAAGSAAAALPVAAFDRAVDIAALDWALLPARPPVRVLYCVWRN